MVVVVACDIDLLGHKLQVCVASPRFSHSACRIHSVHTTDCDLPLFFLTSPLFLARSSHVQLVDLSINAPIQISITWLGLQIQSTDSVIQAVPERFE